MNPDAIKNFVATIVAAVSSATGMLLFVGVSQGDVTKLGAALQQIGEGAVNIFAGTLLLVSLLGGMYTAVKQTTKPVLKMLNKNDEIKVVEAVPGTATAKIADEIPGTKIKVAASKY